MRIVVSLVVAVALFWLAASLVMRWSAAEHSDPAFSCDSATALLGVWTSQKIIEHIGNDGRDVTVKVDSSRWLGRLTKKARIDIGMAAWCQARTLGTNSTVQVIGTKGETFGRVIAGRWSSELFGE